MKIPKINFQKLGKKNSLRAFSLLEVSLVILVISLIIVGIVSGSSLISKSRITAAQSLTSSSPVNVTDALEMWLEPTLDESFNSVVMGDGESLASWQDRKKTSSKAEIEVVSGGPTYNKNAINRIHAVNFQDSGYVRMDGSKLNNSNYTIIVVEKRISATTGYFISSETDGTLDGKLNLGYSSDAVISQTQDSYSNEANIRPYAQSSNKARIFTFTHHNLSGKKIYINGTLAKSDATNLTPPLGLDKLAIGRGYTGEIGEVLVFSRTLKRKEAIKIEDYLGTKWHVKLTREAVADCTEGTLDEDDCAAHCPVSILGESDTSVIDGASGNFDCDQTGYSDSIAYSCSNGNTISDICECDAGAGYEFFDGICKIPANCTGLTILGSNITSVNHSATAGIACNITGYEGDITGYVCSNGSFTQGSDTCDCNTGAGYELIGGVCIEPSPCTVSIDGVTLTEVAHGSTSTTCDITGYTGDTIHVCNNGAFTLTSGCGCEAGYVPSGTTCVLSTPFITTWKTNNTGASSNTQIILPLISSGTYNFVIDWGDGGATETITSATPITHEYGTAGTYTVKIYGEFEGWQFDWETTGSTDAQKLTGITQWGNAKLGNAGEYFSNAQNLVITATDDLDISGTTNWLRAFLVNTSMPTSSGISGLNMASATSFQTMFYASNFNENISGWNTTNVTNMIQMFRLNTVFNQPIGSWNTANVSRFDNMLNGATSFDQDLSNWNISSATNFTGFLSGVTLSTINYNKLLAGWAAQAPNIQSNVTFDGGNSMYNTSSGGVDGVAGKAILEGAPYNWIITDGGPEPTPLDCSGGTETTSGGNRIHTFTTVGSATLSCSGIGDAQILVVAGGGGGGSYGGGGAGGFLTSSSSLSASSYSIVVGDGGAVSTQGANSSFIGGGISMTSIGGGRGSDWNTKPENRLGGSGGGGGAGNLYNTGGHRTVGQGNLGGSGTSSSSFGGSIDCRLGGGGGGANQQGGDYKLAMNGSRGGNGGNGRSFNGVTYAGGGGGSINSSYCNNSTANSVGGLGGGGRGSSNSVSAQAGTDATGGGGGSGKAGGSGIVIIYYTAP